MNQLLLFLKTNPDLCADHKSHIVFKVRYKLSKCQNLLVLFCFLFFSYYFLLLLLWDIHQLISVFFFSFFIHCFLKINH